MTEYTSMFNENQDSEIIFAYHSTIFINFFKNYFLQLFVAFSLMNLEKLLIDFEIYLTASNLIFSEH